MILNQFDPFEICRSTQTIARRPVLRLWIASKWFHAVLFRRARVQFAYRYRTPYSVRENRSTCGGCGSQQRFGKRFPIEKKKKKMAKNESMYKHNARAVVRSIAIRGSKRCKRTRDFILFCTRCVCCTSNATDFQLKIVRRQSSASSAGGENTFMRNLYSKDHRVRFAQQIRRV